MSWVQNSRSAANVLPDHRFGQRPGRTLGGQVQFLGSPQWKYSITGILNGTVGSHTDDPGDFELGGTLETIKNSSTDCTLTWTDPQTGTVWNAINTRVVDFTVWRVAGATMIWFGYTIKLIRKA